MCFQLTFALLIVVLSRPALAEWPNFLGPSGNPVTSESRLPLEFAVDSDESIAKNIAWRVPLPGRSVSGPIVIGDLVITTSSAAMEERWLHVAARK